MYVGMIPYIHHEAVKAVRAHCRVQWIKGCTTGLLGTGALLARGYGTSGKTLHLKFTIPES